MSAAAVRGTSFVFPLLALALLPLAAASEDPRPALEPPTFESRFDAAGLVEPCTGPDDWVHLTSSEWLHGELRVFKDKRLDFKSERMKAQSLKWKHVAEFCTPYPMRFVTNDMTVLMGYGRMRLDKISIWLADGRVVEIPRDRLFSILRGEPTEWNRWAFKATLGLDANTGNTVQTSANVGIDVTRRSVTTLLAGNYQLSLGTANGADTVNRHEAELRGQKDITRRLYLSAFDIGLLADEFQNISFRAIPGSGIGYRFLDRSDFELEAEVDVIYQLTRFVSPPANKPGSTNDAGNRFTARFRWDITGDLEFSGNHSTTLVYTDFQLSSYNTRLTWSYDLTDILKLEFRLNHNRVQEPIPDANGAAPKRDDLQAIAAFGFDWRP